MSEDGWVGSWRPHRPRGPISAQYRTPGPKYGLPGNVGYNQHDPTRSRAPAYTFGLRLPAEQENRSPGPQYLVRPGFTHRGKDGIPAHTICGRPRAEMASKTPGPAHYSPERADKWAYPNAPTCFLRSRPRESGAQETPGPAAYRLPTVLGPRLVDKPSAPTCFIVGRGPGSFGNLNRSPGPSHYAPVRSDVFLPRSPRCTIVGRTEPPKAAATPGPSDYSPPQVRRQGVTFGVKHSEFRAPVMMDAMD
ncbi:outer dense fiber protein 3B [Corapipo altera]|uniref:outer dense fiber protein 3B n=1 Tax=Corapipo altera TaxID=415028 RepID=UPI000FD67A36|nr:outer dense fiber protein 3B [Corapipo altera]